MARSAPWRRTCSDLVFWRQTEAQNATIYILRETGPTGFLLKTEGETKPCKAFLGDPHSCTCTQFLKDRDLCKHICWLLLKKFRVPQTDPMSWQKGLVEREINQILRGLVQQMRKKVPTAITRWRRPLSASSNGREVIPQREIADDDVCPICQDELLLKRLPVTYCKFGCGNSIHIKCMKIWAEHQKTQGETTVKCPFCREDFGPFELLKHETRNAEGVPQGGRMDRHIGVTCQSCHVYPIEGKCYRCNSCADFYLCQTCFNTPIHTQHAFQYRHKRNQRWRPAGRAYGAVLPQAVVDDLVNREITENDYDLLMQLDSGGQAQGSDIPEDVIQSFPLEKVRENGPLLQPGIQCRVCLRGYQVGQYVRKLPRCKHKFHQGCIDNWLLHSKPTCPIDGQVVWDRLMAEMEGNPTQNRPKKRSQPTEGNIHQAHTLNLEIPGTGIVIRTQEPQQRNQPSLTNGRQHPNLQRRNSRTDRESNRILGQLSRHFSVSGTGINQEMNSDMGPSVSVPGGRLLHRTNARRTHLSNRLADLDDVGINYQSEHEMSGIVTTQIEQENVDPLEHVIAANLNQTEDVPISPTQEYQPDRVLQERHQNAGSLFAREVPASHDTTAHLLSNAQRLDQYAEIPNVFMEAQQTAEAHNGSVLLDSYRTEESNHSAERSDLRPSNEANHSNVFADVPPEHRLFSMSGGHQDSQAGTQLMFDPSQTTVAGSTANRGHYSRSKSNIYKGRPHNNVSSAPPTLEGERGRPTNKGWSQGQSVSRNRSNSRDLTINGGRPIPQEGEHLLERLNVFTDLYLGNSPQTQPPTTGTVTATGLPPRPQRKNYGNHDAARQRRFENNRRKNNFALEGNAYSDVTLRDLLGS